MPRNDDFRSGIKIKVAERAAYLCSSPHHLRLTLGPSGSDTHKSVKSGKAAHICAASPGGPRYDENQSSAERKGIGNAIWLCSDCAEIIDKNNGLDVRDDELRIWKKNHEAYIRMLQLSGCNPLLRFRPGAADPNAAQVAVEVVKLLEVQGALFMPFSQEDPRRVALALDDIRKELRHLRRGLPTGSSLDERLKAMQEACRLYMNTTPDQPTLKQLEDALGGLRKAFGIHLKQMRDQFQIALDSRLQMLLPQ